MSDSIFLLGPEGLKELVKGPFESEDVLQSFLEEHPDLLAVNLGTGDQPLKLLLVSRESGVPDHEGGGGRWSVDHLFVDKNGIPTLVEVKRSSDTRIRREVVGQMLDYAANGVVYWPVESICAQFEESCRAKGLDPDQELEAFLSGHDASEFWERVDLNLQAGKIRMLFVADKIPAELQCIVEFLNKQMRPAEVLALELKHYISGDNRILVPRVIGQTSAAQTAKSPYKKFKTDWTKESFLEHAGSKVEPKVLQAIEGIMAWTEEKGLSLLFGKGAVGGPFYPALVLGDQEPIKLCAIFAYGSCEFTFGGNPLSNEQDIRELMERLNQIPGIDYSEQQLDTWGSFRIECLTDKEQLEQFCSVLDWYLNKLRELYN